jgi:hypothetical protein
MVGTRGHPVRQFAGSHPADNSRHTRAGFQRHFDSAPRVESDLAVVADDNPFAVMTLAFRATVR